jgi:hypothetical protein
MNSSGWTKAQVNEALVALYLRLNGYFTSGLVVHSDTWGFNRTEIDCLAVRLPNHAQPDTGIGPAPFLHPRSDRLDLLICEVKSSPESLAFNEKLRDEIGVLEDVLRWAGVFDPSDVQKVADSLRPILKDGLRSKLAHLGIQESRVRVRGLLCCPPAENAELSDGWCLFGPEILRYAKECFNPDRRRSTCSTRYNLQLWGSWLGPIVEYFKELRKGEEPSVDSLYTQVKAT